MDGVRAVGSHVHTVPAVHRGGDRRGVRVDGELQKGRSAAGRGPADEDVRRGDGIFRARRAYARPALHRAQRLRVPVHAGSGGRGQRRHAHGVGGLPVVRRQRAFAVFPHTARPARSRNGPRAHDVRRAGKDGRRGVRRTAQAVRTHIPCGGHGRPDGQVLRGLRLPRRPKDIRHVHVGRGRRRLTRREEQKNGRVPSKRERPRNAMGKDLLRGRSFFGYCKNNFLNNSTQMKSIQPKMIPKTIVSMQITRRTSPPFCAQVDHLTTSSTIQFTTGMSSSMSCTILDCLLNQVIRSNSSLSYRIVSAIVR